MSEVLPREATSTQPQDLFVELFAQAFGVDKVRLLSPEHPVQDIDGTMRYVDFALRTATERFAFEIDGLVWHHPECITIAKFEDDLLRQNSLIHDQWRVYRWAAGQMAAEDRSDRRPCAESWRRLAVPALAEGHTHPAGRNACP
jgi:hypothetical protein